MLFENRSRRPPKDPVNALLSFGYTLLTNELLALVHAHGLDPHIGFLHGIVYGRPSLALDLVEEFRHPIIDKFTLNLFNRRCIKAEHFQQQDEGFYLTDEGKKIFFRYYDQLLKKQMGGEGHAFVLQDLLKHQVRCMIAAIKNRSPYKPFQFRA